VKVSATSGEGDNGGSDTNITTTLAMRRTMDTTILAMPDPTEAEVGYCGSGDAEFREARFSGIRCKVLRIWW
jgi:hypothetical protein